MKKLFIIVTTFSLSFVSFVQAESRPIDILIDINMNDGHVCHYEAHHALTVKKDYLRARVPLWVDLINDGTGCIDFYYMMLVVSDSILTKNDFERAVELKAIFESGDIKHIVIEEDMITKGKSTKYTKISFNVTIPGDSSESQENGSVNSNSRVTKFYINENDLENQLYK